MSEKSICVCAQALARLATLTGRDIKLCAGNKRLKMTGTASQDEKGIHEQIQVYDAHTNQITELYPQMQSVIPEAPESEICYLLRKITDQARDASDLSNCRAS